MKALQLEIVMATVAFEVVLGVFVLAIGLALAASAACGDYKFTDAGYLTHDGLQQKHGNFERSYLPWCNSPRLLWDPE